MEVITLNLYGKPFVSCFIISQEYRLPREMNDDACLTYVMEGSNKFISGTKTFDVTTRESILMKCGNYVVISEGVSKSAPLKAFNFHFDYESIKKAFGSRDLSFLTIEPKQQSTDSTIALGKNTLIDGFVHSIISYFDNKEQVTDELLAIKLVELVTILINSTSNPLVQYIMGTFNSPELLEFDKVIEANIFNNLSIPELAHLTNRSVSTFKRDFKSYYQESPAKYLKTQKLEKANRLLSSGSLPVSEVAWECGFDNVSHFSTSFTNQYGSSPKLFRENQHIDN